VLLTAITAPRSRIILEKLIVALLVKKSSDFYETQRLISIFTGAQFRINEHLEIFSFKFDFTVENVPVDFITGDPG
jgi:hypothetical protein